MPQNSESNILKFPTTRKAAFRNPAGWWKAPLPMNVRRLSTSYASRPSRPVEPLALLVLALIETLQLHPAGRRRTRGLDVLGMLQDLEERWSGDEEVRIRVQAAMLILLARRTGRV